MDYYSWNSIIQIYWTCTHHLRTFDCDLAGQKKMKLKILRILDSLIYTWKILPAFCQLVFTGP